MLPALPTTDLLSVPPDAEGIDIWSENFERYSIPAGIGVYCFYDPNTGIPHYIGSGCAVHVGGSGVRRRVPQYRGGPGVCKHDFRIGQIVRERKLLLKVWLVHSRGDAHKYETDALTQHRPSLNKTWTQTPEETIAKETAQLKAHNAKMKESRRGIYDPEAEKTCSQCKLPKKCIYYRRNDGLPLGVSYVCRACEALGRKLKSMAKPPHPSLARGRLVREFILEHVKDHPTNLIPFAAVGVGISKGSVRSHIKKLVADKKIVTSGYTKAIRHEVAQ